VLLNYEKVIVINQSFIVMNIWAKVEDEVKFNNIFGNKYL